MRLDDTLLRLANTAFWVGVFIFLLGLAACETPIRLF